MSFWSRAATPSLFNSKLCAKLSSLASINSVTFYSCVHAKDSLADTLMESNFIFCKLKSYSENPAPFLGKEPLMVFLSCVFQIDSFALLGA